MNRQDDMKDSRPDRPRIVVAVRPSLWQDLASPAAADQLAGLGTVVAQEAEKIDVAELAELARDADVIITGWKAPAIDDTVLAAAPRLRLIAHSAGSVKWMVSDAMFARGIRVVSAAGGIAPAVAEHTLALMFAMLRQVHVFAARMRAGQLQPWGSVASHNAMPELSGQRVGIIGASRTARPVIRVLRALGADVRVSDPFMDEQAARALDVQRASLEQILPWCDILSLHAPLTDETEGMIASEQLAQLKDGAIVINTARGALIDEAALVAELSSGRLRAALDTFEREPLPVDHPLLKLDNVLLTPHMAGCSPEARHRQGQIVIDEIGRFLRDEPLEHEVTPGMLASLA